MTKICKKYFVKSTNLIGLIFLGFILFSCENDINVVNSLVINSQEPVESSYDVDMILTDSGKVKLRLRSPEVNSYVGDRVYTEMPKGIAVDFLDSVGNITSSLTADYTISYDQSGIMEAKHKVVVINLAGEKLRTERLIWDQNKHIIYTQNEVQVETKSKILFGDGITSDEKFNNWEIPKPRGNFDINDDLTK
jgi:LPS export ABC transporter protein LptC